jgi:hypothetical protein
MSLIKDSFLTKSYKQGFIFTNRWRSEITGKSGETVEYCPRDGLGAHPCKSIRAAKCRITRFAKLSKEA